MSAQRTCRFITDGAPCGRPEGDHRVFAFGHPFVPAAPLSVPAMTPLTEKHARVVRDAVGGVQLNESDRSLLGEVIQFLESRITELNAGLTPDEWDDEKYLRHTG